MPMQVKHYGSLSPEMDFFLNYQMPPGRPLNHPLEASAPFLKDLNTGFSLNPRHTLYLQVALVGGQLAWSYYNSSRVREPTGIDYKAYSLYPVFREKYYFSN